MKIYFVASIKGRKTYLKNYEAIIDKLNKLGYSVIENILKPEDHYVYNLSNSEKIEFYKKVLKCIDSVDIVVSEVSYPSINVGYEISLALDKGKPVIALYVKGNEPHLLQGLVSEKFFTAMYNLDNLKEILEEAILEAQDQIDVRFNFFIPPSIGSYLDWITKHRRLPRAVFLRRLIEEHMKRNKEYKAQG